MPYHRDYSFLEISEGVANALVRNCGWISVYTPFGKGPNRTTVDFLRQLADKSHVQMTRGYHVCDLCDWEDADYGNGEVWVETCGQYWRMPRMVWHYVADHEYKLPDEVDVALVAGDFTLIQTTSDCEDIPTQKVEVPYYEIVAIWDADRYDSLSEFHAAIGLAWNHSHSWRRDGSYGITLDEASSLRVHNLFAEDPDNFPDRITVTRIVPNKTLNGPPQSGDG